jgi:hypothetical protein
MTTWTMGYPGSSAQGEMDGLINIRLRMARQAYEKAGGASLGVEWGMEHSDRHHSPRVLRLNGQTINGIYTHTLPAREPVPKETR